MAKLNLCQASTARLTRLLQMEYSPRELAEELGCDIRTIRRAIEAGCPHRATDGGRVYVVGTDFQDWYAVQGTKQTLGDGEAFCVRCRQVITMLNPAFVRTKRAGRLEGTCPLCDGVVNRFISGVLP